MASELRLEEAREAVDGVGRLLTEGKPAEAQIQATLALISAILAVADAIEATDRTIDRLLGHLESRVISVRNVDEP